MDLLAALDSYVLSRIWEARTRLYGVDIEGSVRFFGRPTIRRARGSKISIGSRGVLISCARRNGLGTSRRVVLRTLLPDAQIAIGEDVGINGATISAARSISIGNRVLIGGDAAIIDTDFHPVHEVPRRYASLPEPRAGEEIVIEDDVVVGARAIVLKGARIGRGTVIGAGSVVTGEIPSGVIAIGNPCRVITRINP